ncbi:carboxyl transferase [Hyaloraphidium curvatum]|nr:carboxyl transferase [Hyaloraphidium curvatum]
MCLRGAHHVQSCPALSPSLSSSGAADNDSWEAEVAELHLRRKLAKVAPEDEIGVKRQRDQGKLLVRERIAAVVDPGSFQEIGSAAGFAVRDTQGRIVGYQRSNLIAGLARIDGQLVMVGGDDFSVRGGSAERSILSKLEYTESLAREYRIPLIRICDGAAGSVNALFAKGSTYIPKNPNMGQAVKMLHEIPVVAAVVGSAAGWSAAKGVLTHFSVMSADTGSLYAAGPPVVEPATGEKLSKEALGGVRVHCTNGVMDNPAENELDAFEQCKRFLSYLPANRWLMPPLRDPPVGEWPTAEGNAKLLRVIPKRDSKPYDPKEYLDVLLDPESLFEIGPIWGRSHRTFLARVNGKPVVVLASDPRFEGGAITHDAAMKVSRIIGIANTFHLPIVSFVDCPGFVVGSKAEKTGAIRAGTRLGLMAQESKVPWFTILIRKVYGVAGSIFATRGQGNTEDSAGIDPRYCWPSLSSGSIPIEGGTMAAFKRQLGNIADEGERKKELARIEGELREIANPFRMVERFEAEEMIDPRETRGLMVQWVEEVAYRSKIPQLIARDSTLQPGVIAFYSPY